MSLKIQASSISRLGGWETVLGGSPEWEGLNAAENLLKIMQSWIDDRSVHLLDCAVDYPKAVIEFTPRDYVAFALEAVRKAKPKASGKPGKE